MYKLNVLCGKNKCLYSTAICPEGTCHLDNSSNDKNRDNAMIKIEKVYQDSLIKEG